MACPSRVLSGHKILALGVVNQEKAVIKQLEQVQARDRACHRRQSRRDPSDVEDRRSRNHRRSRRRSRGTRESYWD